MASDSVKVINTSVTSTFATNGYAHYNIINMATTSKPYTTTLNVVPNKKGLFYLQISMQPGLISFNNGYAINLAVNFNVANKHWYLFEPYNPGFINAIIPIDYSGFGSYCFRVK